LQDLLLKPLALAIEAKSGRLAAQALSLLQKLMANDALPPDAAPAVVELLTKARKGGACGTRPRGAALLCGGGAQRRRTVPRWVRSSLRGEAGRPAASAGATVGRRGQLPGGADRPAPAAPPPAPLSRRWSAAATRPCSSRPFRRR
jgi:hypothetical protein